MQISSLEQDVSKLRNHLIQMEFPYLTPPATASNNSYLPPHQQLPTAPTSSDLPNSSSDIHSTTTNNIATPAQAHGNCL